MFNNQSGSMSNQLTNEGNNQSALIAALDNMGQLSSGQLSSPEHSASTYQYNGAQQQSTGGQASGILSSQFGHHLYSNNSGVLLKSNDAAASPLFLPSVEPAQIAQPPPQLAIRTIFVTGFPADVKERELHNLLKFLPGFEASQMHMKGATSQGFALFSTPEHARFALETITQCPFDDGLHLRCEMAHKNLFVKDGDSSIRQALPLPGNNRLVLVPLGHQIASTLTSHNSGTASGINMIANAAVSATPTGQPSLAQQLSQIPQAATQPSTIVQASITGSGSGTTSTYVRSNRPASLSTNNQSSFSTNQLAGLIGASNNMAAPGGNAALQLGLYNSVYNAGAQNLHLPSVSALSFAPVSNKGDKPPCNTLFVGNLSSTVDEEEIATLFGAQPGFKQIKVVKGAKQVTCFVEFEDVSSASAVHTSLQGAVLASSDRGGIRVQYSKNSFGRRDSPLTLLPPQLGPGTMGGLMTQMSLNQQLGSSVSVTPQSSLDQRWSHPPVPGNNALQGPLGSQINPNLLRSLNNLSMGSNDTMGGLSTPLWSDGPNDIGGLMQAGNPFQFMNSMSVNPGGPYQAGGGSGHYQLPSQAAGGGGLGLQGLIAGNMGEGLHNTFSSMDASQVGVHGGQIGSSNGQHHSLW